MAGSSVLVSLSGICSSIGPSWQECYLPINVLNANQKVRQVTGRHRILANPYKLETASVRRVGGEGSGCTTIGLASPCPFSALVIPRRTECGSNPRRLQQTPQAARLEEVLQRLRSCLTAAGLLKRRRITPERGRQLPMIGHPGTIPYFSKLNANPRDSIKTQPRHSVVRTPASCISATILASRKS